MSRTLMALLLKFLMTFVFAGIAFVWVAGNSWMWAFYVAVLATVANYLIGDLMVLPSMGNIVASLGDGIMGVIAALVLDWFSVDFLTTTWSLVLFGALVAVGEYFFHQYLRADRKVAP